MLSGVAHIKYITRKVKIKNFVPDGGIKKPKKQKAKPNPQLTTEKLPQHHPPASKHFSGGMK